MKSNRIVIIAAVLVLLGLVMGLAGFAMVGFSPRAFNSRGGYEEKSFFSSSPVTLIDIDIKNTSVRLEPSYDNKVSLTYYENDAVYYTVKQSEDGKLSVTMTDNMKWYDYFLNISDAYFDFTIAVPEDYEGDIRVRTSNGEIDISNIKAGDLNLSTDNSVIKAERLSVDVNIQLDSSNGKISVSDVIAGGSIICGTSNSEILIDNCAAENISAESSSGAIGIKNTSSRGELIAETSNSNITLGSVSAGASIVCASSNGSVKGEIYGSISDFTIKTDTSNGRSNLPTHMRGGDKKLDISTSNGDISIDFIN